MAGHPLRPATHHCLGRPLPYQLANEPQTHLRAMPSHLSSLRLISKKIVFGITPCFHELSPTQRQIIYVLLTRSPLSTYRSTYIVRLACLKRAASVRSEPGSNSPLYYFQHPKMLISFGLSFPCHLADLKLLSSLSLN